MPLQNKKKKSVIIAVSVITALALIAGGSLVITSCSKTRDETPENSNFISGTENGIMPMSVDVGTFAATVDGNTTTLTAAINPSNSDNKKVDWAAAWVNPSSAWATGKNVSGYVTVTPASDGALTATVKCLAAFGEKVKITVVSRENPDAKAECTADYRAKILDAVVKSNGTAFPSALLSFNGTHTISFGTTMSVGTITDPYIGVMTTLSVTNSAKNAINAIATGASFNNYAISSDRDATTTAELNMDSSWATAVFSSSWIMYGANQNAVRQGLKTASATTEGCFTLTAVFTGSHSTMTKTYAVKMNTASLTVIPVSMTLNETGIQF